MEATKVVHKHKVLAPKLRFKGFVESWTIDKLENLIEAIGSGWSPQCEEYSADLNDWGVLKTTSVVWEGFDERENKKLPDNLEPRIEIEVKPNDILITRAGPTNRVGVAVHVDKVRSKLMLSDKIIRLKTTKNNSSKFVAISLANPKAQKQLVSKSSGLATSQTNISQDILLNTKLFFPSYPEQQKIACFLSAVDEKILQLTRKKDLLDQYKKGVMQQLFSGKLRFKDEKGKTFLKWEEKKLGLLTDVVVGGTPSTTIPEYWNGQTPWLSSGELNNGEIHEATKFITTLGLKNSSAKLMPKETVLLAMTGATLGRIGFLTFESSGNQSIAGFLPNQRFYSKYLFYNLQFSFQLILSYAGGAAQPGINKNTIENLQLSFPLIEEQKKIGNYLSNIDNKIEGVNKQITQVQTFKKGLLQQMFV